MNRTHPPARHRIFLLSVWRVGEESGPPKLRFRLEDPRTGERRGFNGLDTFVTFLKNCLTDQSDDITEPKD